MSRDAGELPPGWMRTVLGEIGSWGSGGTPLTTEPAYYGGTIPWVTIGDLRDGIVTRTESRITERGLQESSAKLVAPGSVLIAMYGSIGKLGIAGTQLTTNQAIAFCDPGLINARYLFWYLMSQRNALKSAGKGGTQSNISQTVLKTFPFLVAPLVEQHRIVAAIEEHLSRLDAATAALRRVKEMLPVARASILEAAVDGAIAQTLGVAYDVSPTPLGSLIERIEAGRSFRCEERPPRSGEVGVVKVSAVTWGEFDLNETKTVREAERVEERFFIKRGDFLFSRANTIQLVGACVLVKADPIAVMLSDKILRFVLRPEVSPDWLLVCLRSRRGRREIERLATGNQESMRNIGQDRIKQIVVPVPTREVQAVISGDVDSRLSRLAVVESTVDVLLRRAKRMRQSILERAFSGLLVSQDPRDEPAEQLLERISSSRARSVRNLARRTA